MDFPRSSTGKESACNAGYLGSVTGLGRSPEGGHGNPLQYSCLENLHGQRSLAGWSPWNHRVRHHWATKHSTAQLNYSHEQKHITKITENGLVTGWNWKQLKASVIKKINSNELFLSNHLTSSSWIVFEGDDTGLFELSIPQASVTVYISPLFFLYSLFYPLFLGFLFNYFGELIPCQ